MVANNKQLASNFASADDATRTTTTLPEGWPRSPSGRRRSHIGGTTACKKRKTNVIESDDDVDVEDVDNEALPAKLGKCSKGTDALTASPAFD